MRPPHGDPQDPTPSDFRGIFDVLGQVWGSPYRPGGPSTPQDPPDPPVLTLSLGYSTREMFSARFRSSTAWTYPPTLTGGDRGTQRGSGGDPRGWKGVQGWFYGSGGGFGGVGMDLRGPQGVDLGAQGWICGSRGDFGGPGGFEGSPGRGFGVWGWICGSRDGFEAFGDGFESSPGRGFGVQG